jgi:hypothetical protein
MLNIFHLRWSPRGFFNSLYIRRIRRCPQGPSPGIVPPHADGPDDRVRTTPRILAAQ